MKHLTVDEIIKYVSLTTLNQEAIDIASAVTGHIRSCKKCLILVRRMQMLYDEFENRNMRNSDCDFKKFIAKKLEEKNLTQEMLSDENLTDEILFEKEDLSEEILSEENLLEEILSEENLLEEILLEENFLEENFFE